MMSRNTVFMFFAIAVLFTLLVGCQSADNTNTSANRNANANRATATANANNTGPTIGLSRDEFEKKIDYYKEEAKKAGRDFGERAEDLWLWTKVRAQLGTVNDLRDSTINVDVNNGVVTLGGTVADDSQKIKAVQAARSVEGVKDVRDELRVEPESGANKKSS